MQVFNELIKVSKESILNKHFEIDMVAYEKLSESEKESIKNLFPTDDEKNFMQVFKSTAPQLARLQRKMSVCLDVEVLDYDFNCITFTYSGNTYEIQSCKNAYKPWPTMCCAPRPTYKTRKPCCNNSKRG